MQENAGQSRTKAKFLLIAVSVVIFSVAMLIISVVQIVNINKLNNKLAEQEQQIETLTSQYDEMIGEGQ